MKDSEDGSEVVVISEEHLCVICLENYYDEDEVVVLPCKRHVFH